MGPEPEIELDVLVDCAQCLVEQFGKELPGQVHKAATSSRWLSNRLKRR